jgi:acetyl-CoA C-acetyltransferase
MQIMTGQFEIVAVEAHSKISDALTFGDIILHAYDPLFEKPIAGPVERQNYIGNPSYTKESPKPIVGKTNEKSRIHPYYLAGLEMQYYLSKTGTTEEQCAMAVIKNKKNAFKNPYAKFEANVSIEDVMESEYLFKPVKKLDISPNVDGAIAFVLASNEAVKKLDVEPIWFKGFGWSSESPWISYNSMNANYATMASNMAYRMADIKNPKKEIDIAEIDDRFSYKELQHLEAIGLANEGEAAELLENGSFDSKGSLPINTSGGSLGIGNCFEATGLQKALEIINQLRGNAGKRQVSDAETGIAQSWRGLPTKSGAVGIFGR